MIENMLKTKIITLIIVSVFFSLSVAASAKDEAVRNLAVKELSRKLESDLALNRVNLKIGHIENKSVSNEETIISGFGTVANAEKISLTFDVVVNPLKSDVVAVNYDIVTPDATNSPSTTEKFLMKNVMNKIKNDYKTNEIVIAIDNFQTVKNVDGTLNYVGTAEVRVGMEWNRIEFDVQKNLKKNVVSEVKYKTVEE